LVYSLLPSCFLQFVVSYLFRLFTSVFVTSFHSSCYFSFCFRNFPAFLLPSSLLSVSSLSCLNPRLHFFFDCSSYLPFSLASILSFLLDFSILSVLISSCSSVLFSPYLPPSIYIFFFRFITSILSSLPLFLAPFLSFFCLYRLTFHIFSPLLFLI
jgi:hypothetical protein